jgi:hypothetical protein
MNAYWRREFAADANAIWFVGVEASRLSVLAPPGVSVSRRMEIGLDSRQQAFGWQWAVWGRESPEEWPMIDEDLPNATREIDTVGVLRLVGDELHELVWRCLWAQLQVARRVGRQRPDTVPSEDLARAGALSAAWLSDQLAHAFPNRVHLLDGYGPGYVLDGAATAPDDAGELVQPLCSDRHHLLERSTGVQLRSGVAGWLGWKLLAREQANWVVQKYRTWKPGDDLDGCRDHFGEDPGDRSGYSWGSESAPDAGPVTEELPQL